MVYNDTFVSTEHRYSIGIESDSQRYYVSIPVSNGILDYEEYYQIDSAQYEACLADQKAAIDFVGVLSST